MLHTCTSYSSWNLCSSIQTRRAFTRLTCSCRIWWAGRPASGCSDTRRPHPPLRSCRCRPSCPQQYRDSESCVPRRWDPYGEWWFERAGRRVGLGEGARHSCDPDNTQRKTVASSNNGCSGKKGKRKMETNENEGKKKKTKNPSMWNSSVVNTRSSVWLPKTNSRTHIYTSKLQTSPVLSFTLIVKS